MNVPSSEEMRAELGGRLALLIDTREEYLRLNRLLTGIGVDLSERSVFVSSSTQEVLTEYFTGLCRQLTAAHANNTPAEVSLNRDYYHFQQRRFEDDTDVVLSGLTSTLRSQLCDIDIKDRETQLALMRQVTDAIHFDDIEAQLRQQVDALVDTGITMMADMLVSDLNMYHARRDIKIKGRHVIFEMCSADYWYRTDKYTEVGRINDCLLYIQEQADIHFGGAASALMAALRSLSYESKSIPSRTVFGKGNALEIVCFKGKYEFRFTHAAFDALLAFVSLHGSDRSIDRIAEVGDALTQHAA